MNSIFRVCLAICLAFIACSFATAAEPEAGSYAAEVFADDPLCDYRFEDGEATVGPVIIPHSAVRVGFVYCAET